MPVGTNLAHHDAVNLFLNGLLPDNPDVRAWLGGRFGVDNVDDPFEMLLHVGLDCAGAAQFCPISEVQAVLHREGSLTPVDDSWIEKSLVDAITAQGESMTSINQRRSLAGWQPKIALHRNEDGWFEASGSTPTTHILKPDTRQYPLNALNEHVCLQAARLLGIPAAATTYEVFGQIPTLVVERYDRVRTQDGNVTRLHQEDLCQTLGYEPDRKYESRGGPTAVDVAQFLTKVAALGDTELFADYLVFNYLVGATDAHAKNFSLLLRGPTAKLAPMYDVASEWPWAMPGMELSYAMAFSIGGEARPVGLTDANWTRFARDAGIGPSRLVDRVHELAQDLPDALSTVFAASTDLPGCRDLQQLVMPPLQRVTRLAFGAY
jgi:serine/threonine-protein kinase HipA